MDDVREIRYELEGLYFDAEGAPDTEYRKGYLTALEDVIEIVEAYLED